MRKLYKKLFSDGVMPNPSTNMQVSAGTGMNVTVSAGFAICNGCLKLEESSRTLAVQASESAYDRIDTVVLRLNDNDNARICDFYVLKGTPATTPVHPALTRTESIWEIGLADLFIAKNSTGISNQRITDTRYDTSRCGVISSISQFDTTTLYQQVQSDLSNFQDINEAQFLAWFEEMKNQLSEDAAGNLQNQCTELDQRLSSIEDIVGKGMVHNAIYRGKNLGTTVTAEQYAAISAGTFEDLYIGDYWTIGGVNYRIAAFDYYWNCGNNTRPLHHAVIVPDKCLYNAVMNTTNTTTGGYIGSQMYTTNIAQAKTTIKAAFSGHVVNHRNYFINAVSNGYSSGGAWVDSEVDLMNEQMVYGSGIFSPVSTGSAVPVNYRVEKNQLPLFAMNPAMLNTRETYWLRDVITAAYFARVDSNGWAGHSAASASLGVRPAFCIS